MTMKTTIDEDHHDGYNLPLIYPSSRRTQNFVFFPRAQKIMELFVHKERYDTHNHQQLETASAFISFIRFGIVVENDIFTCRGAKGDGILLQQFVVSTAETQNPSRGYREGQRNSVEENKTEFHSEFSQVSNRVILVTAL